MTAHKHRKNAIQAHSNRVSAQTKFAGDDVSRSNLRILRLSSQLCRKSCRSNWPQWPSKWPRWPKYRGLPNLWIIVIRNLWIFIKFAKYWPVVGLVQKITSNFSLTFFPIIRDQNPNASFSQPNASFSCRWMVIYFSMSFGAFFTISKPHEHELSSRSCS